MFPFHRQTRVSRSAGLAWAVGASLCAMAENPADVAFVSSLDQTTQRYVLKLPEGELPRPAVLLIALHGHGSDRWQFIRPTRDETRAALDAAQKYRCLYVSPDFRARTFSMGPAAEADVMQIISDLKLKFAVEKVVLCGGSMGGTGALTFAALHPERVDGVVAMNATANLVEYENFQDAIQTSFGGTKQQVLHEYKRRSAEYWPDLLTMPLAMTLGGQVQSVPPHSALRLGKVLQMLGRPVKVIHREETGHTTSYADAMEAFAHVFAALNQ